MKIIDTIAILGALAWLPQIISWVYNWLKKPKYPFDFIMTVRIKPSNS